jgi:hypothetical protein
VAFHRGVQSGGRNAAFKTGGSYISLGRHQAERNYGQPGQHNHQQRNNNSKNKIAHFSP